MFKYTLIIAFLLLATANAATIAVLEITLADDDEMGLTVNETKFLTDELRRQATVHLSKGHTVLTREKIISLTSKTTENLSTVIDIGIATKSDYVTNGFIGKLGSLFTLTVELYETSSGNLLGYFVKESTDLKGLLDAIRESAPIMFAKIMTETASEPREPTTYYKPGLQLGAQPIPTNIPTEQKKSKTSFWVAIGLDALGAAAIGLGIYNNAKSDDYYKESQNIFNKDVPREQYQAKQKEFDAKYKEMQDAETMRNIFYATGGALLLGGVAVHIWF